MADAPRFYRSRKTVADRVGDIMGLFAKHADLIDSYHVMNEAGEVAAFAVQIRGVAYKFAPQVEGVRQRMKEANALTKSNASPKAVAWGQMFALLEMQLEFVANGVADIEDVFGGWALTSAGHTVGAMIRERRGELLPGEHPLLSSGES